MRHKYYIIGVFVFFSIALTVPLVADAAILKLSPSSGAFTIDSTFDINVFLDTQDEIINVVDMTLRFPPDMLQLVSPSAKHSIIEVWTSPPHFNNQTGEIHLQGGIPGGLNVSQALVTRLTFRVKRTGMAVVRFLDATQVLLNDGKGTDGLQGTQGGVFTLILPPPAGPIVVSETHPDQTFWYSNPNILLTWASEENVTGYSYVLNKEPVDVPDDISEGVKMSVVYKNIADSTHYFHIKSLRGGVWGGITHFAINVDTRPPADFPLDIEPAPRTSNKRPVLTFDTSDALSGFDYYELKIINLDSPSAEESLFFEVTNPHVISGLEKGDYDLILRAYDKTGNYREVAERLELVSPLFKFITGKGLQVKGIFIISWPILWVIFGIIILLLGFLGWRVEKWHKTIEKEVFSDGMPDGVQGKLEELKKYKERYGKIAAVLLVLAVSSFIFAGTPVLAQTSEQITLTVESVGLVPPLITTVPRNISNEDVFYLGGRTELPQTSIIIHLQDLESGETVSMTTESDKMGEWFYRHDAFLPSGMYRIWIQGKIGNQMSPPSPEIQIRVAQTALQFGGSRISLELLYFFIIVILILVSLALTAYIVHHSHSARRKHGKFMTEIEEVEEAVRRGFAMIKRDIEDELDAFRRARGGRLSREEREREKELLRDLEAVRKHIGKELADVERLG